MAIPQCYRCKVRSLECCYQTLPSKQIPHTDRDSINLPSHSLLSYDASEDRVGNSLDPLADDLLPSFPDYHLDWQDAMANLESFSVPDYLTINDAPSRSVLSGEIYQQRIVYAVQRLRSFPASFVSTGRTAFIHQSLYDKYTPQTLGDTMAVCALYDRKSYATQLLVFRVISQHANRLVEELDRLGSSTLDLLASVQALTLVQIIRLFDGDIRQRADAERTQPVFVDSVRRLQQHMLDIGDDWQNTVTSSQMSGADPYDSWLYAESLRRTIIMGYTLQGLYCFLKNGWDDSHHEFENLSFFGQKALWLSSSSFQWELALKNTHALPIRFSTWDADIACANPEDIEDLGMVMMALIKGVDHCCHWVGGQFLSLFGLQQ